MNDSAHIARLLFRYIRKELSPEELTELNTWREADLKNEEFFQVETDPEYIRTAYTRRVQAKEKTFLQLQKKYPGDREQAKKIPVIPLFRIPRVAAALLITVVLGAVTYFLLPDNYQIKSGKTGAGNTLASIDLSGGTIMAMSDFNRGRLAGYANIDFMVSPSGETVYAASNSPNFARDKMFKLYTARGGHLILRLPDNSHVWLNERSTIWYPPNFSGDSIKIIVEGEAYLQVAKNSRKFYSIFLPSTSGQRSTVNPASAGVNGQRLTVNGPRSPNDSIIVNTSSPHLNLRSYPDEDITAITLLKGKAAVHMNEKAGVSPLALDLLPGQQVQWGNGKFGMAVQVDVKKVMDWEKW